MDRADTAMHEATHGVTALWLGKRVEWIRIAERPIDRSHLVIGGGCRLDPSRDLDALDAVWLLAPGLYEASGIALEDGAGDFGLSVPIWPVADGRGDRHQLYCLIRLLDLSESDYNQAIAQTRELLAEPSLRSWVARVASALGRKGHLTGDEVEALRPANSSTLSIQAEKPIQIASVEC